MTAVCLSMLALGCSKPHPSDSTTLQGTWSGQEIGANGTGSPSIVFQGSNLELHEANPKVWYKAAFSLREDTTPKQLIVVITDCPFPRYVGKTAYAIYQLQDGMLTVTANEPGNPVVPTSFDAAGARKVVFKQK